MMIILRTVSLSSSMKADLAENNEFTAMLSEISLLLNMKADHPDVSLISFARWLVAYD